MTRTQMFMALVVVGLVAACSPVATTSASPSLAAFEASPSMPTRQIPSSSPSTMPVATPVPTPAATQTPVPSPVAWKTYRSKRYQYSIGYLATWIATPGTSEIADQFDPYLYPRSGPLPPNVSIWRDVVTPSISVKLTAANHIARIKKDYGAKLKSNKPVRLHGYAGRILVFEGTDGGRDVRIERLIIGRGKVGYFLTLYTDLSTAAADHAIFKKMYLSWKPTG
jgi:hypothetical protein